MHEAYAKSLSCVERPGEAATIVRSAAMHMLGNLRGLLTPGEVYQRVAEIHDHTTWLDGAPVDGDWRNKLVAWGYLPRLATPLRMVSLPNQHDLHDLFADRAPLLRPQAYVFDATGNDLRVGLRFEDDVTVEAAFEQGRWSLVSWPERLVPTTPAAQEETYALAPDDQVVGVAFKGRVLKAVCAEHEGAALVVIDQASPWASGLGKVVVAPVALLRREEQG